MKKYKDININIKEKTKREKEVQALAKKLNITKEEVLKKLNGMYIKEGAKFEEYFKAIKN